MALGWACIPAALVVADRGGALIGVLAVRTAGIYTINDHARPRRGLLHFTRQNYAVFNGFSASPCARAGRVRDLLARPAAILLILRSRRRRQLLRGILVARSTFGLSLQAIRDNPRRMNRSLQRLPASRRGACLRRLHRALGGVLLVWSNQRILARRNRTTRSSTYS